MNTHLHTVNLHIREVDVPHLDLLVTLIQTFSITPLAPFILFFMVVDSLNDFNVYGSCDSVDAFTLYNLSCLFNTARNVKAESNLQWPVWLLYDLTQKVVCFAG